MDRTPTTLTEYLERYPDTVLPCTCDDPAVPFGHGHFMSCPKSSYFEVYRRGFVETHLLQILLGQPRDCGSPDLFNTGVGSVSCDG